MSNDTLVFWYIGIGFVIALLLLIFGGRATNDGWGVMHDNAISRFLMALWFWPLVVVLLAVEAYRSRRKS